MGIFLFIGTNFVDRSAAFFYPLIPLTAIHVLSKVVIPVFHVSSSPMKYLGFCEFKHSLVV